MIQSGVFWLVIMGSLIVFWSLPKGLRYGFLACASVGYLATLAPMSILGLSVWALAFYWLAPKAIGTGPVADRMIWGLILAILGYLAYFKYIPPLIAAVSGGSTAEALIIPLGISYFTFKLIHYAIEVRRGNITDRSLQQFLCYIFLFSIFTAGPIERFDQFLANQDNRLNLDSFVVGLTRIFHGLIKKLVIGEMFLRPCLKTVTTGKVLVERLEFLHTYEVWGFMVISYLIMYMDFSAYSDIAIGTSRLFGLRIMENFNFPIIAKSISDYWKRWHVSLSTWCQTYVYMPVIGLTRNPYIAAYASFLVMGLWHAGTFGRICWGAYHATGVAIYMMWSQFKRKRRWRTPKTGPWAYCGVPLTMVFVVPSLAFLVTEHQASAYASVRILAKLVFINLPALFCSKIPITEVLHHVFLYSV